MANFEQFSQDNVNRDKARDVEQDSLLPRTDKLQQQVEELCGATIRAASGEKAFRFRGRRPEVDGKSSGIRAPHLQPDLLKDDFQSFRGAADGIGLRLKYSDRTIHLSMMPSSEVGQIIVELLEQLRVEALVDSEQLGTVANINHRYRQWCSDFCHSKMIENHIGLLVYTIAQVVWSRLSGSPVNEATEGLIEPQRMMLAPHIGVFLVGLKRHLRDQHQYGENALGIANVIDEIVSMVATSDDKSDTTQEAQEAIKGFSLISYPDISADGLHGSGNQMYNNEYRQLVEQLEQYKVFCPVNDRVIQANKLILPHQAKKLREQQDTQIMGQGVNIHRLAKAFSNILASPHRQGWDFEQQDGYIDGKQLNKLVTSTDNRDIFKVERHCLVTDCSVTFLLDNSGSMKTHMTQISMLVELMTKALERAGATTEILGFTTRVWQGGKTYKRWRSQGSKPNPGRLTELEHIVYKDSTTSLKQARYDLMALLKPELFREGIDGEALQWAANRLRKSTGSRKILFVLSDGCPMETATNQTNTEDYLDNHLRQVSALIDAQGDIELYALGFGLDLSHYYSNSLALDLPKILENSIFNDILQILRKR